MTVDWSAAVGHSANDTIGLYQVDTIGLYQVGAPDANPIATQKVGSATTGRVTLPLPAAVVGTYEFRYLLSDGVTRAAVSNSI